MKAWYGFSGVGIAAGMAAVVLLAGGCGKGSGPVVEDTGQPSIATPVRVTSAAQLTLPLDSYGLSPEQEQTFQRARGVFLHGCMKTFGLDFKVSPPKVADYPKNAAALGWRGEMQSSRYGYHGPPGIMPVLAKASQWQQTPIVIPQRQLPVFEGDVPFHNGRAVPTGGCEGAFQRKVDAGLSSGTPVDLSTSPEMQLETFEEQVGGEARADTRFKALNADWQACMKRAGYTYAQPDAADADQRWAKESLSESDRKISGLEIKTAVTDESCRMSVNYSGVLLAITTAYQNRLIKQKGSVLKALHALLLLRLKNSGAG